MGRIEELMLVSKGLKEFERKNITKRHISQQRVFSSQYSKEAAELRSAIGARSPQDCQWDEVKYGKMSW